MRLAPLSLVLLVAGTLVGAAPVTVRAQQLRGLVVDHEHDRPVADVLLRLHDRDDRIVATTLSGDSGRFELDVPAPGRWRITTEILGYGPVSHTFRLDPEEVMEVEVRLAVEAVEVEEPVVVTASSSNIFMSEFHRRRRRAERSGFGHFIHGEELRVATASSPSDLVRRVPGVRVDRSARGGEGIIRMRGGCIPALYIDGMQINHSRRESLDTYVDVFSIEGVEVYRGVSQPGGRYHDGTGCGLVLVWTRRGTDSGDGEFSWTRLALGLALIGSLFLLR